MSGRRRAKRGNRAADIYVRRQGETVTTDEVEAAGLGVSSEHLEVADTEEEDEPVVIVDDDEPEDDDPGPDEEDDEPEEDTDRLSILERQLAAARAENTQLRQKADTDEGNVIVSQHAVLQQALNGAKLSKDAAERAYAAAAAKNDHVAMAKANTALTEAVTDIRQFQLARDELGEEIKGRQNAPKKPAGPTSTGDAYIDSIQHFNTKTQAFLTKHRKVFDGNVKMGEKALAHARIAIADGIEDSSPEFFAYIEEQLGLDTVAKTPKKTKRLPAPPPQRGAPPAARGGNSRRGDDNELTKAEREFAITSGVGIKQYAKNKLEIQKNGKDPSRDGLRFSRDTEHSSRR